MSRFIASGFGVGLIPRRLWNNDQGAGTFGSALAALIGLALIGRPVLGVAAAVLATIASVWSAQPFEDLGDPGWIVMDEVAGTLVALIGLTGWPWVVALVVARVADITKKFPGVAAAERLHGAVGITADDIVAGFWGLAAGWAMTLVF